MRAVSVRLRGVMFACLVALLVSPGNSVAAAPSPAVRGHASPGRHCGRAAAVGAVGGHARSILRPQDRCPGEAASAAKLGWAVRAAPLAYCG